MLMKLPNSVELFVLAHIAPPPYNTNLHKRACTYHIDNDKIHLHKICA